MVAAIRADPGLTASQRTALIEVYQSFVARNGLSRDAMRRRGSGREEVLLSYY